MICSQLKFVLTFEQVTDRVSRIVYIEYRRGFIQESAILSKSYETETPQMSNVIDP